MPGAGPGIQARPAGPRRPGRRQPTHRRAAGTRSLLSGLAALIALAAWPAFGLDDADRGAFRGAIDRQLGAFRRDAADDAWREASPGIRSQFGSPERFLDMVRQGYPPVYRPGRYAFGEVRELGEGAEQSVRIDDAAGIGWTAVYSFEKQPDGTWAISGCRLLRAPDEAV